MNITADHMLQALTLVTIVLITTLIGRVIANRFAIKER